MHDSRFCAAPLLQVIGECGFLDAELRHGLIQMLAIDSVIEPHQQVALLDELEILNRHFVDVTAQLRADDRGLAAYQSILGAFYRTAERRQLPGVQHNQNADQGNAAENHRGDDSGAQ